MIPVNTNHNVSIYRAESDATGTELGQQQRHLSQTSVQHLHSTAHQIWQESDAVEDLRGERNAGLAALMSSARSGFSVVQQASEACRAAQQERQRDTERLVADQTCVGNATLAGLVQAMNAFVARTSANMRAGVRDDTSVPAFRDQVDGIRTVAEMGLGLSMQATRDRNDRALMQREELAADLNLCLDLLESHIRIATVALARVSDQFREEHELKFRTIEKAIVFVQTVQESMQVHASIADDLRDKASARRMREIERVEAENRAMKELDMSQDEARRATALLDKKEDFGFRLKKEELAMQKCRDQQEHERRTKRYFSIWRFLFG